VKIPNFASFCDAKLIDDNSAAIIANSVHNFLPCVSADRFEYLWAAWSAPKAVLNLEQPVMSSEIFMKSYLQ